MVFRYDVHSTGAAERGEVSAGSRGFSLRGRDGKMGTFGLRSGAVGLIVTLRIMTPFRMS